jgi:hypothetical protein
MNFLYKKFDVKQPYKNKKEIDLFIACPKRNQNDLILTDVINRLVIPENIKYEYFEC